MKKIKKMGIGGLPAGSPDRTVPRGPVKGMQPQQPAGRRMRPQVQQPAVIRPQVQQPAVMRPQVQQPAGRPMPATQPPVGRPMPQVQQPAGRPMGNTPNQMAGRPMKKGGKASSASKRADGCAAKGKTKGKMI